MRKAPPLRTTTLFLALILALTACNKSSEQSDGGTEDPESEYAGLAFMMTDKEFQSSQLAYNDLATGELTTVLAGESGDPWLTWQDGLFLFNRSPANLNYRRLDPRTDPPGIGTQTALPKAGVGDPHAALLLAPGRMMLAYQATGILVILNPETGALSQELGSTLDVGEGEKAFFRPSGIWRDQQTARIFVTHQGIGSDYALNGSQALFVFEDDGQKLTPIDQDDAKEGVQGIPLAVSRPGFLIAPDGGMRIGGLCFSFDVGCGQGLQSLDPKALTLGALADFSPLKLSTNGPFIVGSDANTYFASVIEGEAKVVMRIDAAAMTREVVHTYLPGSNGCCALYFDGTSGTLYVGDRKEDGSGLLSVYGRDTADVKTIDLSGIPYSHAFVPK